MAAPKESLVDRFLGFYIAYSFILFLIVLVSPLFLAVAGVVFAIHVYRAYLRSPARLGRTAHKRSMELYEQAQHLAQGKLFPDPHTFTRGVLEDIEAAFPDSLPSDDFLVSLLALSDVLYDGEGFTVEKIPPPPAIADAIQDARYHDLLVGHIAKVTHPDALPLCRQAIAESLIAFIKELPPLAFRSDDQSSPHQFNVKLMSVMGSAGHLVDRLALPFYSDKLKTVGLFAHMRAQLDQNLHTVSGVPDMRADSSRLIFPPDHRGSAEEIISGYLRFTPLEYIFDADVPFAITTRSRMEHWHLVAGSGHGKTQTLQHIIMGDLRDDDPPALIIVDSQGDMLRKIERLALFEDSDRLIVIDPEDDYSPALNMFDVKTARLQTYSRAVREQVEAGIIELFNYVFGALASELTAKQGTAFAYITRLMLAIPGATIHTFRELMETSDPSAFDEHIERLDTTARAFFRNQFFNRGAFGETRQQIARRLYTVLQVPAFERMFASPVNRLDMFTAMQERKVVLVNTSKALLKTDASALFGRYMIALTLNAAFERVAVPESGRTPAYLIIDEAAEYFDDTLERLLAQARKFRLGVLFAHQHMDQLSPALRSAVAANTTIKMAGGVSDHDARQLAADMRTSPDFIAASRKHGKSTEFACYVRNFTDTAVRVSVPFGTLEDALRMSKSAQEWLLDQNRSRYAVDPYALSEEPVTAETAPPPEEPAPPPQPPPRGSKKPKRRDPDDVDMRASEF